MNQKITAQGENRRDLAACCPFAHTLQLLGQRWRPAILWKIHGGAQRYADLRRELSSMPRRSRYDLTARGKALVPVLDAMRVWGEQDLPRRAPDQNAAAIL